MYLDKGRLLIQPRFSLETSTPDPATFSFFGLHLENHIAVPTSPTLGASAMSTISIKSIRSTRSRRAPASPKPSTLVKPSHHCAYKMPRNPKYDCARAGTMHQEALGINYCTFHDGYAKDRCQTLVRYLGFGGQCSEIAVHIDKKRGKRLCAKHGTSQKEEDWAEQHVEREISTDGETKAVPPVDAVISIAINAELTVGLEADSSTGMSASSPASSNERPTTADIPISQEWHDRIAAMYMQCNICLEEHEATVMNSVPGCGHKYRGLCLSAALSRSDTRRYNCSGCRRWIAEAIGESGPGD